MFQLVRRSQCSYCSFSRNPSPSGRVVVRLIVAHAMSDVGMYHGRCRMYLSNDPKTKCDIWSSGHVTNTFDIVHGTSQHRTFSDLARLNAPIPWNRSNPKTPTKLNLVDTACSAL